MKNFLRISYKAPSQSHEKSIFPSHASTVLLRATGGLAAELE